MHLSEIARAVREDALAVFNGDECPQETRDAIEYCYGALCALCAIGATGDSWRVRDEATVPLQIERISEAFGSLRRMADALDIDVGYLSRLKSGEKDDPSDEVLRKLGLIRIVTYAKAYNGPKTATKLWPRTKSG